MNKFIKSILVSSAFIVGLSSCNDFLTVEPVDKLVQDNYYTSAEMVRANTLSLYSAKTWGNYYMNFSWKLDELVGDMFYTYDQEGQWYFGTYTDGNQYINEGWKGLYNVIAFCNSVINDMPTPAASNGVAQADINQGIAEARCIRGYCYYLLAEIWHNAPIIENNSKMIGDNNLQVPCNTQKSIYKFALADLDYAVNTLGTTDQENFRVTKYTALAMRAKLKVTMASHTDYDYDRATLYSEAANDAKTVIDAKTSIKEIDFSTLYDVETNNGPESLFAIQCFVGGYSFGNPYNTSWSRSSVIADQTWGAGKGPTLSLQSLYDQSDKRRPWTYMTLNDYYPNLNKANGGYTYLFYNRSADGTAVESANEMHAHIKKYIIGKAADCDGNVGLGQDGANNIYMMRLADVYFIYAEAIMGTSSSTTNQDALDQVNSVRARAGLAGRTSLTYKELLRERRVEFAFEASNWFDILRLSYREGKSAALQFVNSGYETNINRAAMYVPKTGITEAEENLTSSYVVATSVAEGAQYDPINLPESCFQIPIPAAALTSSPQLANDPVDY